MPGSRFTVEPNTEEGVSAACIDSEEVRKNFPWVVWGPSPPFALGAVWAVCASETYALAIASALERSREVANRAIEDERKATVKALTEGSHAK